MFLREHTIRALDAFLGCSDFNMQAKRLTRPHMAIKPKIEVSAGGEAFNRLSQY
jgi:hypothetical protein